MPASRLLPSEEAVDLIALVRDLATSELAPLVARAEREEEFPREVFRLLGRTGLLGARSTPGDDADLEREVA